MKDCLTHNVLATKHHVHLNGLLTKIWLVCRSENSIKRQMKKLSRRSSYAETVHRTHRIRQGIPKSNSCARTGALRTLKNMQGNPKSNFYPQLAPPEKKTPIMCAFRCIGLGYILACVHIHE